MEPLARALDRIYSLNVGVVGREGGRHERPHKPVLLLAILDLVGTGRTMPNRVEWNQELRAVFGRYFEVVRKADDQDTPENPFYYLKSDGFWEPVRLGEKGEVPLEAPPLVGDTKGARVFGRFVPEWQLLLANRETRAAMRDAVVARYFPGAREELIKLAGEKMPAADARAKDGRSAAFRRQVLEIYDYQCCACGLRIWLPQRQLSFVDAAHVIPFAVSRNDHPTNGIALCKNHHWAMDQGLIAPAPEGVWRVSGEVDARRSRGEEELTSLAGKRLLVPAESAYAPHPDGLVWRVSRLSA